MGKKYRLRKNYEFNHVYNKGKSAAAKNIIVFRCRNRNQTIRVGICCGKKVGKSVKRNRAKRMMREAFRTCVPNLKLGYNYVLVARQAILQSTLDDIIKSFLYCDRKIDKLENKI